MAWVFRASVHTLPRLVCTWKQAAWGALLSVYGEGGMCALQIPQTPQTLRTLVSVHQSPEQLLHFVFICKLSHAGHHGPLLCLE